MIEAATNIFNSWINSDMTVLWALVAWVATFFTGESGAILILTFALGGLMSLPVAIIFVFLGSLSADMFWYTVTASTLRPWFEKRIKKSADLTSKQNTSILELAHSHPYLILLIIKFLVGIRLVLTIYISARKDIPFRKYFICNIIANILFVSALLGISAAINASVGGIVEIKNNLAYILTFIVVIGLASQSILHIIQKFFSKILTYLFTKKEN